MRRAAFAVLLLFLLAHQVSATPAPAREGAVVSGRIERDTVWTAAEGPYIVVEDVIVPAGVTLTIKSGTEVRFAQYKGLVVEGKLVIAGTEGEPVVLTANGTEQAPWRGIKFKGEELIVRHAKVCWASVGIDVTSPGEVLVENSLFANCSTGIWVEGRVAVTIKASRFVDDDCGVEGSSTLSGLTLLDCEFSGCSECGVRVEGAGDVSDVKLRGLDLRFNGDGVRLRVRGCASSVEIRECEVLGNVNGLLLEADAGFADCSVASNVIFLNTVGITVISLSPLENTSSLLIADNRISSNAIGIAIGFTKTRAEIVRNDVSYNLVGISVSSANVAIHDNDIYGNSNFGLASLLKEAKLAAENNYWGDASGPFHAEKRPGGKGDKIEGNVDFEPFRSEPVGKVNERPVPALSASTTTALVGETIRFSAESSRDDGKVELYYFNFGDGSVSGWVVKPVVEHIYEKPGRYNVTVTVVDDSGARSAAPASLVVSISTFTVTSISISPDEVFAGHPATVTVSVVNPFNSTLSCDLALKVNGTAEETKNVTLPPMGEGAVEFVVVKMKPGKYLIEVDSHTAVLTVLPPKEASITVLGAAISSQKAEVGEPVNVTVKLANAGGEPGMYTVRMRVNGTTVSERDVVVPANATVLVPFTLTASEPGVYVIEVEGYVFTLKVAPRSAPAEQAALAFDQSIGLVAAAIAAIAVLLVVWRVRRRAPPADPSQRRKALRLP